MENILGLARVDVQIGKNTVSSHLLVVRGLTVDCLLGRDLLPYSTELKCMSRLILKKIQAVSEELMNSKNKLRNYTDSSSWSIAKDVVKNVKTGQNFTINCIKENLDDVASTIERFKIKLSEQLKEDLAEALDQIKLNRDLKLEKTKWLYNRNIRPESYSLAKKLAHKWEGPFVIVKKLNALNYQVRCAKNPKARARTVHHNRLKRFFGPSPASNTLNDSSFNEQDLYLLKSRQQMSRKEEDRR
ncbi:Transposon Ty3-G Gag-Pol poly [Brachionus plicatilis]|uniref:Transposon Ty3-G Gag-Pol poly n=1 Tax=Brachionus plicatilis TaxID=10195 RepID=A0A3M7PIL6_BRAPC|nr:Transposon Ty3-G Gag-Pol poly [Brachionus plicatilis]